MSLPCSNCTHHSDSPIDLKAKRDSSKGDEKLGEINFFSLLKAGPCKEAVMDWQHCFDEADNNKENVFVKCNEFAVTMMDCLEAHSAHYHLIFNATALQLKAKLLEEEYEKKEGHSSVLTNKYTVSEI